MTPLTTTRNFGGCPTTARAALDAVRRSAQLGGSPPRRDSPGLGRLLLPSLSGSFALAPRPQRPAFAPDDHWCC